MRALIILALTALLAWQAGTGAIAGVTRATSPETALRFSADDPVALALNADQTMLKSPAHPDFAHIVPLARKSLTAQAVNPRALRLLGYAADSQKKSGAAHDLTSLSARTSRREVGAQFWLIEDSVNRNDVAGALTHYDAALRTSTESSAVLFPILAQALADETLERAFVPFLKSPPSWLGAFVGFAIGDGGNLSAVAATIEKGGGLPDGDAYRAQETALLGQLAAKGKYTDARAFFTNMRGADSDLLTSTAFDQAGTDPRFAPMTWQRLDTPGLAVSFGQANDSTAGSLHVEASSGERSVVVRKISYFPAGSYVLSQKIKYEHFANGAEAYWEVKCLHGIDAVSIWRSDGGGVANQVIPAPGLVIQSNCPTQSLELVVAGGSDQDGTDVKVRSVVLSRNKN
jgi:hypothetical protein